MSARFESSWVVSFTMSLLSLALTGAGTAGCRKTSADDDQAQIAAAVGEAMASLDESVQGSATMAWLPAPILRTPDQLKGPLWRRATNALLPSAIAGSCWPTAYSACASGVRTQHFDNCTLGVATLNGSVTLTFTTSLNLCFFGATGDVVARTADFTLKGPYGGTLTVTSPGGGQRLTKTSSGFSYEVLGMQRVLAGPAGREIFNVSTRTTAPIVVTGSSRADLVLVSGALEVSHNLAGYKVSLAPQNIAWSSSCNCAVSGQLTGTVETGKLTGKSASVEITGCGQADVTIDGDTQSVTLDRCGPV